VTAATKTTGTGGKVAFKRTPTKTGVITVTASKTAYYKASMTRQHLLARNGGGCTARTVFRPGPFLAPTASGIVVMMPMTDPWTRGRL